ncbi:MAG: hypothetical protein FWF86_00545, partial [Clostridia bacterium]|nr:hypothetical protein [Clostridia bacterium]
TQTHIDGGRTIGRDKGGSCCVVDVISDVLAREIDTAIDLQISINGGELTSLGKYEHLEAGTYTVALHVNGEEFDAVALDVAPDEETVHTFVGNFIINSGSPVYEVLLCPLGCGTWKH